MCVVYLNWPKLLYNMCMQACGIKRMLASQTQQKNPSGFLVVFYHFHISALFPSVFSPAPALLLLAADKSSDDWVFQRLFFFETVTCMILEWTSESMSDWFTKLAKRFADIASLNRFLDKTLSLESFKRFFFAIFHISSINNDEDKRHPQSVCPLWLGGRGHAELQQERGRHIKLIRRLTGQGRQFCVSSGSED